jgi:hypothetical protein
VQINSAKYEEVSKGLSLVFPDKSFTGPYFSFVDARRSWEFAELERLNWETAAPESFAGIYEPNTFLTVGFHNFLHPKVFEFCSRFPEESSRIDFIECFYCVPLLSETDYFKPLSREQRLAVWGGYLFLFEEIDLGFFSNWPEMKSVLRKRLFGER